MSAARGRSLASAIFSIASGCWLFLVNIPIGATALLKAGQSPPRPPAARALDCMSMIVNAHLFTGANGIRRVDFLAYGSPSPKAHRTSILHRRCGHANAGSVGSSSRLCDRRHSSSAMASGSMLTPAHHEASSP